MVQSQIQTNHHIFIRTGTMGIDDVKSDLCTRVPHLAETFLGKGLNGLVRFLEYRSEFRLYHYPGCGHIRVGLQHHIPPMGNHPSPDDIKRASHCMFCLNGNSENEIAAQITGILLDPRYCFYVGAPLSP